MKASSTSSSEALRAFSLRCAGFAALSACVWALCTGVFLDGYTDDYYERVASPRQAALILGTSRAAQGLVPAEIDPRLLGVPTPLYNFAFASSMTRYGPAYLRAIELKLARPAPGEAGLYLLEVTPLAISIDTRDPPGFPEDDTLIGELHSFSVDPNLEYPFHAPQRGYNIIDRNVRRWRGTQALFLHADGWLEVRPQEDASIEANVGQKLATYQPIFAASRYSPERFHYLERTLGLLSPLGRVALVRLPTDPRMREFERRYMPDFDARMGALAERVHATYFDMGDLDARVVTNDGSHLRQDSARQVSRELAARLARTWGRVQAAR